MTVLRVEGLGISHGWRKIAIEEPDVEPLSEEEKNQIDSQEGALTGEEAVKEFGLLVRLP